MNYQLIIDNAVVLHGSVKLVLVVSASILLLLFIIILIIIKRLRESEAIKNEFITIVAHKFRTPLTRVKWIIDETIREEENVSKRENFQDMQKANEELITLTGTMTQLASAESTKKVKYTMEPVVLCDFVRESAETLRPFYNDKNISLAVACPNPEVMVSIDKNSMAFVLQTLIGNAYLYTSPGRQVDVTVYRERNRAVVSVVDNGIGIESKDISRIFSKFYRAQNAQGISSDGFGVSLYLSRSIVKRHNGTIEAFSKGANQGSTFILTLPILRQ